jgi:hypothetical protein
MPTIGQFDDFEDRDFGAFMQAAQSLGARLVTEPQAATLLNDWTARLRTAQEQRLAKLPRPEDGGITELVGLGDDVADSLSEAPVPGPVPEYENTVAAERLRATGDLYYLYQHERIGVFRAASRLQQEFRAGTVRLGDGPGALALYRYDRRQVLRYTQRERHAAYRRVFGYGRAALEPRARANAEFHPLFVHFVTEVARFWRDRRISEVIRHGATDPSFGSVAAVRRSGFDLRHNLKWASYGHVQVLRAELLQLLDDAFTIFGAQDIKALFGAADAWDVVEEVLTRYEGARLETSPRQRMAVTGREILRWLGQPAILETSRATFEAALQRVGDHSEEWLTSAEVVGAASYGARRPARSAVSPRPALVS